MANASSDGLLGGLRQQLDGLPRRSRLLLLILIIMLALTWMAGLWWWTSSSLALQAEDLTSKQRTLQNLQLLQVQYVQANKLIAEAEQRLGGAARQNPSSFLESKATELGVREQLRDIKKNNTETQGSLQETRYRVRLNQAPLASATHFLREIEASGFMSIENTTLTSTMVKGERLLNVDIDLVSYELVKE